MLDGIFLEYDIVYDDYRWFCVSWCFCFQKLRYTAVWRFHAFPLQVHQIACVMACLKHGTWKYPLFRKGDVHPQITQSWNSLASFRRSGCLKEAIYIDVCPLEATGSPQTLTDGVHLLCLFSDSNLESRHSKLCIYINRWLNLYENIEKNPFHTISYYVLFHIISYLFNLLFQVISYCTCIIVSYTSISFLRSNFFMYQKFSHPIEIYRKFQLGRASRVPGLRLNISIMGRWQPSADHVKAWSRWLGGGP